MSISKYKSKIGIVGCGNISGIYFKSAKTFNNIEIVAAADVIVDRAKEKASEYEVAKAYSVDELLADPEVEIVLNLTIPKVHAAINQRALHAGKHVYAEKPLGINRIEGKAAVDLAKLKGLRIGCAPDTFLGGGLQTCRKLIDDGWIGTPVAATAFMLGHGPESWHPDPGFFYQVGGGPMFDMGPYYLTALVSLLGSVARLTAAARISFPERMVTSEAKYGERIRVEIPTHIAGVMEFENGAIGTLVTSFDVWGADVPRIEIYGTHGSLSVPDPNTFGGPVRVRREGAKEWSEIPLTHGFAENSRGIGLSDMCAGLELGRPHRASGDLAFHVLDIMEGFHDAAANGCHYTPISKFVRPTPLPMGLPGDSVELI